ncbi:PadR family transcriptional regulator [Luteipulveratus halotolerans]|uniref:PadR family transcriptional regulator n=1 Tax=Luteipulveratus halotolerans TaxID=1631356 RepID=A0A0L6CM55_9MICO|nr:PadR family transcriptional regulator [Luteipulveratus halotolerans]KNX38608.1 PadR family transcriptional regulator [Luteipulveratus halotolerans]
MRSEALRGHLDALILASVEDGPRHGYAITEFLSERSGGTLDIATGTLYPALHRLEKAGWLASDWSTVSGRKRRTYELTRSGRTALADQRADWNRLADVVQAVLRPGIA